MGDLPSQLLGQEQQDGGQNRGKEVVRQDEQRVQDQGGAHGKGQGQHDSVTVTLSNIGQITLRRDGGYILVIPDVVPGFQFQLEPDSKVGKVRRGLKRVAEALGIEDFEEDINHFMATVQPLLDDIAVNVWSLDRLQSEISEVRRDPVLGRISFKLRSWTLIYKASEISGSKKVRADLLAKGIVLKIPTKGAKKTWDSFLAGILRHASVEEGDPGALPEAVAVSRARAVISTLERLPYDTWKERGGQGVLLNQGPTLFVSSEQMVEVAKECGVTLKALSSAMKDAGAKVGNSKEKRAGRRKGSFWPVSTSWVDEPDVEGGEGVEGHGVSIGEKNNSDTPSTPPTGEGGGDGVHTRGNNKKKATKLPRTIDTPDIPDTLTRTKGGGL